MYKNTRFWRFGSVGLVSERNVTVLCVSSYWPPNIAVMKSAQLASQEYFFHTAILKQWDGGLCSGTEVCIEPGSLFGLWPDSYDITQTLYCIDHLVLSRGCAPFKTQIIKMLHRYIWRYLCVANSSASCTATLRHVMWWFRSVFEEWSKKTRLSRAPGTCPDLFSRGLS